MGLVGGGGEGDCAVGQAGRQQLNQVPPRRGRVTAGTGRHESIPARKVQLYSLINSCKLQRLDTFECLRDVIDRVSAHAQQAAFAAPCRSRSPPMHSNPRGDATLASQRQAGLGAAPRGRASINGA
jgi:hypothetical protein